MGKERIQTLEAELQGLKEKGKLMIGERDARIGELEAAIQSQGQAMENGLKQSMQSQMEEKEQRHREEIARKDQERAQTMEELERLNQNLQSANLQIRQLEEQIQ